MLKPIYKTLIWTWTPVHATKSKYFLNVFYDFLVKKISINFQKNYLIDSMNCF